MNNNDIYRNFTLDYKYIVIDEIALEGLEGIGIDLLWKRIQKRINGTVTEKMKKRYWSFIVNSPSVSFYTLPEPVPPFEIIDRFTLVDENCGYIKDPEIYLDGPYEYKPIENEYGSCTNYNTRTKIPDAELIGMSYDDVISSYGQHLVLVATLKERWKALAPHLSLSFLTQLTTVHYCILELIGRSRDNGQMTVGKTNLLKVVKDPKLLFYNRKHLQDMDLIRVTYVTQRTADRGVKSILLRLKRFHQSSILSMPKNGILHNLVDYLKDQPDYSAPSASLIKQGLTTHAFNKKLHKASNQVIFDFIDKPITYSTDGTEKQPKPIKRRYICISSKSDESSQSDDEPDEPVLKCQYKVGVNLIRQAYELLNEVGLKGMTQIELAQLIGVEFYTSRSICRMLKTRGMVREVFEDVGRQRTARYVAVTAKGKLDEMYEAERKKFLEYINVKPEIVETPANSASDINNVMVTDNLLTETIENSIVDLKVLDGVDTIDKYTLLNPKKELTLRQLRFANGVLKIIREKLIVVGYQTLSNLVAKEITDTAMDSKALKLFLQKLLADGQIKVFKIKWPGILAKYSVLICAPHITRDSQIIKAKYKEICSKAIICKEEKIKRQVKQNPDKTSLLRYTYPRYVKIRKFHEFIVNMAYFSELKLEHRNLPEGCNYLIDIIPEMTVKLALGNINNTGNINLMNTNIKEMLDVKLRDIPPGFFKELISSRSFQNSLRGNLRALAFFGLVQVVHQPLTYAFDGILYYVNRHAKIINTTGVWPREDVDLQSLTTKFYFNNMDTVREFWKIVYDISINTTISLEKREQNKNQPPVRKIDDISAYDNGNQLGDALGPCGYDSGFYLDMQRLWQSAYIQINKVVPVKPVRIPLLRKRRKQRKRKKKQVLEPKNDEEKKAKSRVRRKKEAVSVEWTKQEDHILMLCKAAIIIMSSNSQPGTIKIRNSAAKEIINLFDPNKNLTICHKRALLLDSSPTRAYEIERLINEFRRRRYLTQKYEGLLKKLKIRYLTNISKYISEARLPMLELVYILHQLSKNEKLFKTTPCIALDADNFHNKFTITATSTLKPYNTYKSRNDIENTLKECIILTVAMTHNRDLPLNMAKKIYSVFKNYPEMVLRKATDELRKSLAITVNKKKFTNKVYKMNLQDLVESSYKLSAGYYRRWLCKLNPEFLDNAASALDENLPLNDIKGSAGINCMSFEAHARGLVDITTATAPIFSGTTESIVNEEQLNVIDIESKFRLNSGSLNVKNKTDLKKCSDLYEDINVERFLNELCRNAVVQRSHAVVDENDCIVNHLKTKGEMGSTYQELKQIVGWDDETLIAKLTDLETKCIIKRVGFYENKVVLVDHVKLWAMTVDKKTFLPSPYFTLDVDIRREIFIKWSNVIMSKVFEGPGSSITFLTNICELITAKAVLELCMFYQKCHCVYLNVLKIKNCDLFSEDNEQIELAEFNQYESHDNIVVFPAKDIMSRYAAIRKRILDSG